MSPSFLTHWNFMGAVIILIGTYWVVVILIGTCGAVIILIVIILIGLLSYSSLSYSLIPLIASLTLNGYEQGGSREGAREAVGREGGMEG